MRLSATCQRSPDNLEAPLLCDPHVHPGWANTGGNGAGPLLSNYLPSCLLYPPEGAVPAVSGYPDLTSPVGFTWFPLTRYLVKMGCSKYKPVLTGVTAPRRHWATPGEIYGLMRRSAPGTEWGPGKPFNPLAVPRMATT